MPIFCHRILLSATLILEKLKCTSSTDHDFDKVKTLLIRTFLLVNRLILSWNTTGISTNQNPKFFKFSMKSKILPVLSQFEISH